MLCLVTGNGSWGRNSLDGRDADFRPGLSPVLPEPLPAPHNSHLPQHLRFSLELVQLHPQQLEWFYLNWCELVWD